MDARFPNVGRLGGMHEDPAILARWRAWAGPVLRRLTPARRRLILLLGAIVVAVDHPLEDVADVRAWWPGGGPGAAGAAVVVVLLSGFLVLAWMAARRFAQWPAFARRWPQICVHAVFWILLALAWLSAPATGSWRAVLACVIVSLPFLLWRVGYLLKSAQRGRLAGSFLADHLFHLWPAFGGSNTPYGKGPDYLFSCEARDEEALARSQLAGFRLLLLGAAWSILQAALDGLVFSDGDVLPARLAAWSLGLPRLGTLLGGASAPMGVAWSVLYLELFHDVLRLAAKGHLVIGVLRLFGFNVFRNTYKPLLAETVAEFWNRFFYYFKELLAQFFFYPAFARFPRLRPAPRLLIAVFAAAFLGNLYYHLLAEEDLLLRQDARGLWLALGPRAIYCALLALGIFVSMRREQGRGGQPRVRGPWRRAASIFGVWTFFAIIHVWSFPAEVGVVKRTQFFASLLGFD